MNNENFSLGHNELALKDLSTPSTPVNTSKKKKTRNQAYQTHKNQVTINLCQPSSRSVAQRTVSTKDIKLGISQLYQIFHYRNHPVLQPRCRDTAKRLTRGEPDNIFRA